MVNTAIADYLRTKRPLRPRIVELWAEGRSDDFLPYITCCYPVTPAKVAWLRSMGYTHAGVEIQGRLVDFDLEELDSWR